MYYTVKQISMRHPAFSEASLRILIHNADKNGFDCCVFRPPGMKKVLIHEPSFEAWIRSNHPKYGTYTKRTPEFEGLEDTHLVD